MRVLLAALECGKGDLAGNLGRHVACLEQARRSGCELAVFPELSLTGSVDPATWPDRAIGSDDPAVERLLDASSATGVAALFGLAERRRDGVAIAQAYAVGGRLAGVQRKRHLGDDEGSYLAVDETAVFELGAARFGSVICAESGVDWTWDATLAAGAQVVFLSAAPALHGRRLDEVGWAAGFRWWEGRGLEDARRNAARLGVWVGMATQAGSSVDEDFPGIAAVIDPTGRVVDRLPDWRPGHLVVDIPVPVDVDPVRWSVRVLVVDEAGRTLLAQFGDDRTGRRWWVPPGGGLEAGEDDLSCARRELWEELGHDDLDVGPAIGRRGGTFEMNGRWYTQYERWYLSRVRHFEVDPDVVARVRDEGVLDLRWWSSEELRSAGAVTGPRDLPDLLDQIVAGHLPEPATDLGF